MSWTPIIAGASTSTAVYYYNKCAQKGRFGQNAPYLTPNHLPAITSGVVAMSVAAKTYRILPTLTFTGISLCCLALLGIQNSLKELKQ